jgi:hypothetical protein
MNDDPQDAIDEWIRRRWSVEVAPGSGEIEIDAAAYASGAWCNIVVSWKTPNGQVGARELKDDAWQYEFGTIVREIVAVDRELRDSEATK